MKDKQLRIRISEKMKANLLTIKPKNETMNSFINQILLEYIYDCNIKNTIEEEMKKTINDSLLQLRKDILVDMRDIFVNELLEMNEEDTDE